MPSVKDFEKKHGHTKHNHKHTDKHADKHSGQHHDETHEAKAKRRPGREQEAQAESPDVAVVDVHATEHDGAAHENTHENTRENKVELNFYGSEILRAKFPKAFDVAESVATEWVHDGNFEGLPLGHPLAQYFAAKGLKKAKEVEKKVMESPVTEKVALQALQAGMKAQEIITQIREKVQKK